MEYKLEFKTFERKDGVKYKVIELADFTVHTADKKVTSFSEKKIQKVFQDDKLNRIYFNDPKPQILNQTAVALDLTEINSMLLKLVQEEESKGYKVLLSLPRTGVPCLPGKDTIEFINSKNGKRIIRGLAKEKDKE